MSESLTQMRRRFHRFPEVGFTEYITTYEIYRALEGTGFKRHLGHDVLVPSKRVGVPSQETLDGSYQRALDYGVPEAFLEKIKDGMTGLVATIDTKKPGPHFAARFDIDGLPITESTDDDHFPFNENFMSKHNGEMHACGHDGHITVGLNLAKYISDHIDQLKGKFTIIFQAAEESVRGAQAVVEKGWLDDVDYFFSLHLGIRKLPVGTVSLSTTDFLATTKFDAHFTGKSAHAGVEPNEGNNSLLAASTAALNLSAIARHRDGTTRINAGSLKAGSGRNVVADSATMEIESRGETTALNDYMFERSIKVLKAAADMYDNDVDIEVVGQAINANISPDLVKEIKDTVQNTDGVIDLKDSLPLGASEDVTFMIDRVQKNGGQATYMLFPFDLKFGHHHPKFDLDESVLPLAVDVLQNITRSVMKAD